MHEQYFHTIPFGTTLGFLIIDPSVVFTKLMMARLQSIKGYELDIECAHSYEETEKKLSETEYHAILLNMHLHDCNEDTVYEKIRRLAPDTAIIITTVSSSPKAAMLAVKNGAQDVLIKSDINDLVLQKTLFFAIDRQQNQRISEEREKLLLSRLVSRNAQIAPLDMRKWADRVTRGLKRINIGFPEKRDKDTIWENFLDELRIAFRKHGLKSDLDENQALELNNKMEPNHKPTKWSDEIPKDVLIAEDSPLNRKICQKVGEKLGMNMTFAHDGAQAVELFRKNPVPLILMDIQMPVMDGLEATHVIRDSFPEDIQPKIIALTASNLETYENVFQDAGIDASMNKPIKIEMITKVLKNLYNVT